jgi:hypothetical protein
MRCGIGLVGLPQKHLTIMTGRQLFCFCPQACGSLNEAIWQGKSLFEMASRHGAAPYLEEAGALMAFSSPMKARGRAVMGEVCHVRHRTDGQF